MRRWKSWPWLGALGLGMLAFAATRVGASCTFSDLRWSSDGTRLEFVAGEGDAARRIVVDTSTGKLESDASRVLEPTWCEATRRILFRDRCGVFELRLDDTGRAPRPLLFLPESSRWFLRAFGEDERGRVLVWTYDRVAGQHALWTLEPGPAGSAPRLSSGPDALRFWQQHNVARPFTRVGGRFLRSTCLRRPGSGDRLCAEQIVDGASNALFRLTLGAPGQVRVLLPQCALAAFAPASDSSLAILGVLEEIDATGHAAKLSAWGVRWQDGKRLFETKLAAPIPIAAYHDSWARWLGRGQLLWADAAGGLARLDIAGESATPLLAAAAPPTRSVLHRVVALATGDRSAAESAVQRLRSQGMEAAIWQSEMLEVQVAAFAKRADAEAQLAKLRRLGFDAAEVRSGGTGAVAAGIFFASVAGPGARSACLRNVEGTQGLDSEIWIAPANAPARRLVAPFAELGPRGPQP